MGLFFREKVKLVSLPFLIVQFNDPVYGLTNVQEKVLLELIESKPLQRLKEVNVAGASQFIIPEKRCTRFEHSLGVMLLLKKLNASLREQAAGLLHDVSHTAFSHVIDFVFPNPAHDYHEKFMAKVVFNSRIPSLLEENGLSVEEILKVKKFKLLEKPLPDLCADRVDYFLRDFLYHFKDVVKVKAYLKSLRVFNEGIVLSDGLTAQSFALNYLLMDDLAWANPREMAAFQVLGDAIKIALEKSILTEEDLFKSDEEVFHLLKNSGEKEIQGKLNLLKPGFQVEESERDYDFLVRTKCRFVDPKFLVNEELKLASEEFPEVKEKIAEHKEKVGQGFYIKIK